MLVSRTFYGNYQLQQCAVQDQAHLTPNSSGEAVSLIQRALLILDNANICDQEIEEQFYGETTARAVLNYKTKRNIINHNYQTRPDNIVGKMTIASLDREMVMRENASVGANLWKHGAIV